MPRAGIMMEVSVGGRVEEEVASGVSADDSIAVGTGTFEPQAVKIKRVKKVKYDDTRNIFLIFYSPQIESIKKLAQDRYIFFIQVISSYLYSG